MIDYANSVVLPDFSSSFELNTISKNVVEIPAEKLGLKQDWMYMNEKEVVNPPIEQQTALGAEKSAVPLWLLGFYIVLLIWTIWNVLRYWE